MALSLNRLAVNLIFCANTIAFLFFTFDVAFDLRDHFTARVGYLPAEFLHLFFEIFAVFVLGSGIILSQSYSRKLKLDNQNARLVLHQLRNDFDNLIQQKFSGWDMSLAEKDIALLILRGLGTSDIAETRKTTLGTVKLQTHKVLQKAGVKSRVEFMSLFMDEFMGIGAKAS